MGIDEVDYGILVSPAVKRECSPELWEEDRILVEAMMSVISNPEKDQYELLQYGKNILKENGVDSEIFMAPGHSYDRSTLRALKAAGFTTVTDGRSFRPL